MKSDVGIKSIDNVDKKVFLCYFVRMLQSNENGNLTLGSPNTIFSIYSCKAKVDNCKTNFF